ncbi:MAG: LPS-assembly protein LptD [Oceanicoccus sp.]
MAETKYHTKQFARRILSIALATSSAAAMAADPVHPHQQWVCTTSDKGQWSCQQQNTAGGQPQLPLPAGQQRQSDRQVTSAPNEKAATAKPQNQWDWVSKTQMADPSVCKSGCDGAYLAPKADWPDADKNPNDAALRGSANSSDIEGNIVSLAGKVAVSRGNRQLLADKARFDRNNNELVIEGNVEVREPDLLIRADSGQIDIDTNFGVFTNARFLQHDSGSRGKASTIQRDDEATIDLENGSYTQCTPDDETWYIEADYIHINNEEGWGSAKGARLNVLNVPVLYAPYFSFPIDDRRKTGFLFPTFASGKDNGFELTTPYYLNLAPNYDATIAPRYIENRGMMLEAELRQKSRFGEWVIGGAHLEDDLFTETPLPGSENDTPSQENRWLGNIQQAGNILGLSTRIDYSKVSDDDFFQDLSTNSLELKRNKHLNQQATLGYRNDSWQIELTAQDRQTIDELLDSQYQLMPRLSIERNNSGVNFETEWLLNAEFTDFQHDQSIDDGGSFVTGERSFAEAGLSYPMRWAAGFIIPSAKIRSINYDLDELNNNGDTTPSASTPLATLDMGLIFERNGNFSGSNFTQTIEPRLFYFYSDYDEQTGNPDFDTRELDFGYSQLFRDTRFSGHDRLDDANQASVGITSRFIDNSSGREVITLSIGQIFYMEDRRVQLGSAEPEDSASNSNIATRIQIQPSDNVWLTNNLLWDSHADKIEEGGFSAHYQNDNSGLYNLGYRFRRDSISDFGTVKRDLSQADASMVLPINDRWSVFGRYRYDVDEQRALDEMVGVQYDDCCWKVRLLYQQSIEDQYIDELNDRLVVESDYAFVLEFQLKGLGSLGNKAESLLRESILGYEDFE